MAVIMSTVSLMYLLHLQDRRTPLDPPGRRRGVTDANVAGPDRLAKLEMKFLPPT